MFIVEGLDYAGKTTVLERLQASIVKQRWTRWYESTRVHQIQHWGKLPPDFDYPRDYIEATHEAQLCDRFVLSELAYGEVFRGGPHPKFDSHARRRVQRELNVTGSVTLLVKADWETTATRAQARCKDEFDVAMKMRQTYESLTLAFQRALQDRALGRRGGSFLGAYDSSVVASEAAQQDVLDFYLTEWRVNLERSMAVMNACPQAWGYLWPKILFVGESINDPVACRPFADDQGASRTLTDLLDLADLGERDLFFWNAYTFRGSQLLTREGVAVLQPRLVVALGKSAHEHLTALGVKHTEFPHPQWIGRFQRKEIQSWAQKLRALTAPVLTS